MLAEQLNTIGLRVDFRDPSLCRRHYLSSFEHHFVTSSESSPNPSFPTIRKPISISACLHRLNNSSQRLTVTLVIDIREAIGLIINIIGSFVSLASVKICSVLGIDLVELGLNLDVVVWSLGVPSSLGELEVDM